ncbi:MAG TPA: autoinducer binding domain-containing protein [Propylenella sp.]|nr:autoinducer binding domain-containing protein [Propylenella sp.]
MGRVRDIQHFVDELRRLRTPKGLERLAYDAAREMGFDIVTMFQHVDLSGVDPAYRHMDCGRLFGLTTASLGWSEHYRDNNLVAVDPRVLACRHTVSPFRTDDMGRLVRITSAQRDVVEGQKKANIGESFMIPVHFPGEPSGSCTFSMACGRAIPTENLAMAHLIGSFAFQAGRMMLNDLRNKRGRTAVPHLTERQLQCTLLVARGLCEAEIAVRLGIATETVKRHLKEARLSYGVAKSVQLVTHALRDGHITLRDIFSERSSELGHPRIRV